VTGCNKEPIRPSKRPQSGESAKAGVDANAQKATVRAGTTTEGDKEEEKVVERVGLVDSFSSISGLSTIIILRRSTIILLLLLLVVVVLLLLLSGVVKAFTPEVQAETSTNDVVKQRIFIFFFFNVPNKYVGLFVSRPKRPKKDLIRRCLG
jgi:hypothetical protein